MVTKPSESTNSNSQVDNQKCCKVPQITQANTQNPNPKEKKIRNTAKFLTIQ